ncbi:MAG: hypothetical protein GY788_06710, partial [bacterium]|nr:hypothetical protein [bacterium]
MSRFDDHVGAPEGDGETEEEERHKEKATAMATSLGDKIKALFEKRRNAVDARAAYLVAEELSLRDLRKARAKTQIALAKELGVGQAG